MKILLQIVLAAFIVNSEFVPVEPQISNQVHDGSGTRENLQHLFDSISNQDAENIGKYRDVLNEEVQNERHAFNEMKEELRTARRRNSNRNSYRNGNNDDNFVAVKRAVPQELEKILQHRQRTGVNTSLDLAWTKEQIKDALSEMGFNVSNCGDRHWKKFVTEKQRNDGKYRKVMRKLCKRYLLKTDADRLEAQKRYKAQVGRKYKLDELERLVVAKLAENNATQKQMLSDKSFVIDERNHECYWKVYYSFSETCADPTFDYRVQGLRNIFAHACLAPWLNEEKIEKYFEETCADFNLYI